MEKRINHETHELHENDYVFPFVCLVFRGLEMETKPSNLTEDAACERCGSFEVMEFAGKFLCADCIAQAGCGCAGHGGGGEN